MINWLKNRLSPSKAKSDRWVELSEALEQTWDDLFTIPFGSAASLRSIYTADEAGQRRKLAEYGKRYEKYIDAEYLATTLAMRKLEMLQKDTALPTELMVLRTLGSAAVNPIKPLYALSEEVYGSNFYTAEQLAELGIAIEYGPTTIRQVDGTWKVKDPAEIQLGRSLPFLTSRVAIVVELLDLQHAFDAVRLKSDFSYLKPLHIVLDKIMYQASLNLSVTVRSEYGLAMSKSIDQHVTTLPLDGIWKLNGTKKITSRADYQFAGSKVIELDFAKTEKLGKTLKTLGTLEHRKLDGSWKVGGIALDGTWRLDGSKKLTALRLGRMYSKLKLDGSWWLGSTKRLDGGWKVGGTSKTVTAEARINIRKGIQ